MGGDCHMEYWGEYRAARACCTTSNNTYLLCLPSQACVYIGHNLWILIEQSLASRIIKRLLGLSADSVTLPCDICGGVERLAHVYYYPRSLLWLPRKFVDILLVSLPGIDLSWV